MAKGNTSTEGLYLPLFNNFGFIMSFPHQEQVEVSNIAITINQLKDFDRSMRINGSSAPNLYNRLFILFSMEFLLMSIS